MLLMIRDDSAWLTVADRRMRPFLLIARRYLTRSTARIRLYGVQYSTLEYEQARRNICKSRFDVAIIIIVILKERKIKAG